MRKIRIGVRLPEVIDSEYTRDELFRIVGEGMDENFMKFLLDNRDKVWDIKRKIKNMPKGRTYLIPVCPETAQKLNDKFPRAISAAVLLLLDRQ